MLQSIRDRLTGPIVWFVIGLIAIPFAFWGIDSFNTGGNSDPVVAEVGDQEITQSQFRQAYEQRYQQYRSLLGESFRADLFDQGQFRGAILDDMVQESALRQFAKESGYRASDATLRDFLIAIPAFQKDGQFSADTYKSLLQQKGLKTDRYEAQVRESLVIDQLRASVQDTAFVTPAEAWEAYRLENQSRELAVVAVAAAAFREKVQLSDEQIASRYEADKSRYMAPERIKLSYIELDRTKLAAADAPAAEALRALYDAEKEARFGSAEERKASHILIGFGADKDAAKKKAEDLLTQIRGGGDFAALAKSNSEDPGSKDNGGDLGWIKKGMMVPRFEEAVFGLAAAGDYAGPVETEFGWHLIRLDEVKAAATRAFEDADVQTELLEAYRAREADRRFQELSTKLEQLAFEKPALEPVAQELGLSVQTTDWFSRSGGSGIAGVEAVKQAAFSPEVLTDGENSKPIPAGPDSVVVVRKAEYEAARQKPLEEVRDLVRESLVVDESLRLAKAEAEALMAEVKAGADLKVAAAARQLAVAFNGPAKRRQADLNDQALEAAFKLPRPEGKPELRVVEAGDEAIVIALSAVVDPARPEAKEGALEQEQARLRDSLAGAEFAAYRKSVEEALKVKIVNPPADPVAETPDF